MFMCDMGKQKKVAMNMIRVLSIITMQKTAKLHILIVIAVVIMLSFFSRPIPAEDDSPLVWFNSYFDSRTTLVYGIQDTDYYPLFFECNPGNSEVNIGIEHEPVKAEHGDQIDVYLTSGRRTIRLSGLVYYQPMYDLARIDIHTPLDITLQQMLAENGALTITIEDQSFDYPLEGISGPASKLMAACEVKSIPTAVSGNETANRSSGSQEQGADCEMATLQIDAIVCTHDYLKDLHNRLENAFKLALEHSGDAATSADIRAGQKAWLASRNQRCALDAVTPVPDHEQDMDPQEYGQVLCLAIIYPIRVAQLMDSAYPPLKPFAVNVVPTEPLQAAYKDRSGHLVYEANYSPNGTLLALGVGGIVSSDTSQVWLFEPSSERLIAASPLLKALHVAEPDDITSLDAWKWGEDGKLYTRAVRLSGADSVFVADMGGYSELQQRSPEVDEWISDAAADRQRVRYLTTSFDEENPNLQEAGYVSAWATRGDEQGTVKLMVNETFSEPYIIASADASLRDFILDPRGKYIFHNSEDGLRAIAIGTGTTRRIKGTYGSPVQTRVLAISPTGDVLVYMASGSCAQDAAIEKTQNLDDYRYVCLARIRDNTEAADPWIGVWSGYGSGKISAAIRRGSTRPEYLVVNMVVGRPGCSGSVSLYGIPDDNRKLRAESYDSKDPGAPVCTMELMLDNKGQLLVSEDHNCTYYHGVSCMYDGWLTQDD